MRRVFLFGAIGVLSAFIVNVAGAAVVVNPVGAGSADIAYRGESVFINPGVFEAVLPDTIVEKSLPTLAPLVFDDVTFTAADLDFSDGFRWTERVHNTGTMSWTGFELKLSETPGVFFTDLPVFSPGLVVINGGGPILASGPNTLVRDASLGTIVMSADKKVLDVTFANPVAPGSFFDIHAPIQGLANATSFDLAQAPVVPTPMAAWSGMALMGGALLARKLRRK